jgi:hypothetical protein
MGLIFEKWGGRRKLTSFGVGLVVVLLGGAITFGVYKHQQAYVASATQLTVRVFDKEMRTDTDEDGWTTHYYYIHSSAGTLQTKEGIYHRLHVDRRYQVIVMGWEGTFSHRNIERIVLDVTNTDVEQR